MKSNKINLIGLNLIKVKNLKDEVKIEFDINETNLLSRKNTGVLKFKDIEAGNNLELIKTKDKLLLVNNFECLNIKSEINSPLKGNKFLTLQGDYFTLEDYEHYIEIKLNLLESNIISDINNGEIKLKSLLFDNNFIISDINNEIILDCYTNFNNTGDGINLYNKGLRSINSYYPIKITETENDLNIDFELESNSIFDINNGEIYIKDVVYNKVDFLFNYTEDDNQGFKCFLYYFKLKFDIFNILPFNFHYGGYNNGMYKIDSYNFEITKKSLYKIKILILHKCKFIKTSNVSQIHSILSISNEIYNFQYEKNIEDEFKTYTDKNGITIFLQEFDITEFLILNRGIFTLKFYINLNNALSVSQIIEKSSLELINLWKYLLNKYLTKQIVIMSDEEYVIRVQRLNHTIKAFRFKSKLVLNKIISNGNRGVCYGALLAAQDLNLFTDGTTDNSKSIKMNLDLPFNLKKIKSYKNETICKRNKDMINIDKSDGTLFFYQLENNKNKNKNKNYNKIISYCKYHTWQNNPDLIELGINKSFYKPFFVINILNEDNSNMLIKWLNNNVIETLNVYGIDESLERENEVRNFLVDTLKDITY